MMKTKFLLFSAIIFLLLGWNSKDGVLFFFFAIHLFTLSIGVFLLKFEKKFQQSGVRIETMPPSDPSES
jgi:hypothetical protein